MAAGCEDSTDSATRTGTAALVQTQSLSDDELRLLVDTTADYAIFMLGTDGTVRSWNTGAQRIKGYIASEIIGRNFSVFYSREDVQSGHPQAELIEATHNGRYEEEGWRYRKDGSRFRAFVTITALRDSNGQLRGFGKVTRDITTRYTIQRELEVAHARFSGLVEHSSDVICILDLNGRVTYASPSYVIVFGESVTKRQGHPLLERVHLEDRARFTNELRRVATASGSVVTFDSRIRHPEGQVRSIEVTASNRLSDPAINGVVLNCRDITERVETAQRLAHMAMHDDLTGLPNRVLLIDRVDQALRRSERSGRGIAIFFVDLDHFKRINDSLGHAAGDQVLISVAERLSAALRRGDTAARLGGDEFVVLAEEIDNDSIASKVADRIRQAVNTPMLVADRYIVMGCSLGISLARGGRSEVILQEADTALYRAKARGRGRWELYDQAMRVSAQLRLDAETTIRDALTEGRVIVNYQAIVDLRSRASDLSEVLVRLATADGNLLQPENFLQASEDSGLIIPLGRTVLHSACEQLSRWRLTNTGPSHIAINVSNRQLHSPGFMADVIATLESQRLPGDALVFELYEASLADADSSGRGVVHQLAALEAKILLKGFGTGTSSLAHLHTFPISAVKIAPSSVDRLGTSRENDALVRSIISIGASLGIDVIAEGVQTRDQADALLQHNCPYAQGDFFGPPSAT